MPIEADLRRTELFRALPDDVIQRLARAGETISVEPDTVICREGDPSAAIYVVRTGRLQVLKGREREVDLGVLEAGAVFGELGMLDEKPRSATVISCSPCTLYMLERAACIELLSTAHSPALVSAMLSSLAEQVRKTTQEFVAGELTRRAMQAEMDAERHRGIAEMVAGVAHELNTPLGVARTGVSIIEDRVDIHALTEAVEGNPEAADALDDLRAAAALVHRNIQRAHKLVETFKHVSVGHFVHERETLDLAEFVNEVVELYRIHGRRQHIEVEVIDRLAPTAGTWDGYPGHLTQALTNLMFNAEKHAYTDEGRIVVELTNASDGASFEVSVRDFGRGMPAATAAQVFDPFFTTARGRGGSGLGLAIVWTAVTEGLQGTVTVESVEGEGTVFRLRFPQAVGQA